MQVAEVCVTALVTPESSEKVVEVLKTFQYIFLSSSSIPPKPIWKMWMQCCFASGFFARSKSYSVISLQRNTSNVHKLKGTFDKLNLLFVESSVFLNDCSQEWIFLEFIHFSEDTYILVGMMFQILVCAIQQFAWQILNDSVCSCTGR